jgi:short-subunit dehydrogenase
MGGRDESSGDRPQALITGATSGIGAAFARALAREGRDLIVTGRRVNEIEAVAAELRRDHGVDVSVVLVELGNERELTALAEIVRQAPRLDFLVNNAGFAVRGHFHSTPVEDYVRMLDVHVRATIQLTHAALPGMVARGSGNIVNVSSLAAFIPYPRNAMYSATKALLNNFSESLRLELVGSGVRVQALCPGLTRTNFHSRLGMDPARVYAAKGINRALTADEVVACSLECLAKDRAICVPGTVNRLRSLAARKLPRALVARAVMALFSGRGNAGDDDRL